MKPTVILSIINYARYYALKFHKPTVAFHIIVSNFGTASYKRARILSQSLAHLACNNFFTVKNAYDFVD